MLTETQNKRLTLALNGLKRGEELKINPHTGDVRKTWKTEEGRSKSSRLFNLFRFEEAMLPLESKVPEISNGKKRFFEFGEEAKSTGFDPVLAAKLAAWEIGSLMNPEVLEKYTIVEKHFSTYRVVDVGIKGYFNNNGRLVYLEDEKGEYTIPSDLELGGSDLIVRCEVCKNEFLQNTLSLYSLGDRTMRACKGCAKSGELNEIIIK